MSPSILLKSIFVINILFNVNILPSHGFERFENVVKPPLDRCHYRGLKLSNEMKVMLISDESTEMSAASLVIGVGAFNDQQNVPGLVNLVGNVLLAGGGDNPSHFERFIESRQGAILAPDTRETDQSFSFRVPFFHFAATLREFAQIFINPRLMYDSDPSILRKAVQAVQREYYGNTKDENERISEVEKCLGGNSYFFNHLYCGNKDTLYEHIRNGNKKKSQNEENALLLKMVKVFYKVWYSSNLMTLAVFGRESLDVLENMVVSLFENIKNKNRLKVMYPVASHPWGPEQLKRRLCIVPLSPDVRVLVLTFPLPDFRDYYDAAPENYVKHYLLDEGRDTLVSVLRRRDVCTTVQFSFWPVVGFAFAKLVFELTTLGVTVVDDIINLTFQYIRMLVEGGVEERMQKQLNMSYIRAFQYNFSTPSETLDHTLQIARNLLTAHSIESVLSEKFFRHEWNPSAIRHFLSFLQPNNMNITLVSKLCSVFDTTLSQEKHYNTLYTMKRIHENMITRWSSKKSLSILKLPTPNDLVPDTWEVFTRDDDEPREPHIIHESSISEIWFMQENTSSPEVFIHLELSSSIVNLGLPERVLWHLFHGLLNNFFDDQVRVPQFGDQQWITYKVYTNDHGLQIKLFGANDKVPILLKKILSTMTTNFEEYISEDNFNDAFKKFLKRLKEKMRKSHSFQSTWSTLQYRKYDDGLETENVFTLDGKLQFADLQKILPKLFRRIFIRGLIHGNYTKQKALDNIVSIIEKSFSSSQGLLLQEILRARIVDPGDGSHHFYQMFNKIRDVYGSSYLFQLGSNVPDPHETVLSSMLQLIVHESCQQFFAEKNENHSYTQTTCSSIPMFPVRSLYIRVLSSEAPQNIDSRLVKFLHDVIPNVISELSDIDFLALKSYLKDYFQPTSLQLISDEYWREITNRSYRFDRCQMEVDILRVVKKSDLLEFVQKNLHKSSHHRLKFTVHILPEFAKQSNPRLVSYVPARATKIEDVISYKTNAALLSNIFKSSGTVL